MEEFVGKIWDRFITHHADTHYPEAVVHLDEIRRAIGIFFRALGGEAGLRIENATDSDIHARRSILQRIAGTGKKTRYAWRDEETLRLPDSIALFPTRELNRDLYLWLTALSAIPAATPAKGDNWISRNQQRTLKTLELWPGLKSRYQNLLAAHLLQRPDPAVLPADEADQERLIRLALSNATKTVKLEYARRPPQPVSLWLHPSPPAQEINPGVAPSDPDIPEHPQDKDNTQRQQKKQEKRKKGERDEMPDGNDGLMSFRLETLWSWAEYTKVDRSSVEDDDDDAMKTAEDMDNITVSKDSETTASKIKLDLDLPASQYDDIVLSEGIAIDEWDYRQQKLQKDHCRLQLMTSRQAQAMELPERLHPQAHKIRRQFESLRPQRHWLNRQNEGTELDLENYINFLTDRRQGQVNSDTPVYRELRNASRDLSCLLLADLSLSTDAHINNNARVIDVIRDSLYLFSEALSASGDRFALHGFSSRNRNHIRFYNIKAFDDSYNDDIRGHIDAIRPGYYTRMGAAIRYATELLVKENASQKLLLILTDGKPNDLDKYEGRYGIEDTRMAVLEAEKSGLRPFCVTIDEQAEDYLPYLFGSQSYVLVRNAEELPRKLPLLYLRLTS
ncbi:MAG: VWA domain-containing protein [Gammaproteobacteria bacterium]|nr:VWA domain-containing protein [Gammaproteobacteria bacterium]